MAEHLAEIQEQITALRIAEPHNVGLEIMEEVVMKAARALETEAYNRALADGGRALYKAQQQTPRPLNISEVIKALDDLKKR